ncbi:hypothetical protein EYF80_030739 [Liparis tanakae]|uniref:Uncharacterized protein n=1 Tax=Liparis tanakae TaxID=230148 RepID=A0A4Z2H078_9TELE|nr:hypothetical protein EYF80_030739 [Liparis tanakae]
MVRHHFRAVTPEGRELVGIMGRHEADISLEDTSLTLRALSSGGSEHSVAWGWMKRTIRGICLSFCAFSLCSQASQTHPTKDKTPEGFQGQEAPLRQGLHRVSPKHENFQVGQSPEPPRVNSVFSASQRVATHAGYSGTRLLKKGRSLQYSLYSHLTLKCSFKETQNVNRLGDFFEIAEEEK